MSELRVRYDTVTSLEVHASNLPKDLKHGLKKNDIFKCKLFTTNKTQYIVTSIVGKVCFLPFTYDDFIINVNKRTYNQFIIDPVEMLNVIDSLYTDKDNVKKVDSYEKIIFEGPEGEFTYLTYDFWHRNSFSYYEII